MIRDLVRHVREQSRAGGFTVEAVESATAQLGSHGYAYDDELFPPLPHHPDWAGPQGGQPQTLAEALLWKMGKWKTYSAFAAHYSDAESLPKPTEVVFFAFARHLQNRDKPIYDQHALRALWAIDSGLGEKEVAVCRALLFKKTGRWKQVTSGRYTVEGYNLFLRRMEVLTAQPGSASKVQLDRFLMPLGQALKENTDSYEDFHKLFSA